MKSEYVYIGRKKCGCVAAITSADEDKKYLAKSVSEFILDGLTIHHVSFEEYKIVITREETFFNCPHEQKQTELF